MEKRFLGAVIVAALLLMVYPKYIQMISPQGAQDQQQEQAAEPSSYTGEAQPVQASATVPSVDDMRLLQTIKEAKTFVIENDDIVLTVNNVGASVQGIELKKYFQKDTPDPIAFLKQDDGISSFAVRWLQGKVNCNEHLFSVVDQTATQIVMSATIDDIEVTKTYMLEEEGYIINFHLSIKNLSDNKTINAAYELTNDANVAFDTGYEKRFVKMSVFKENEKIQSASFDKIKNKGVLIEGNSSWISLRKKYFSLFIKPAQSLEHVRAQVVKDTILHSIIRTTNQELAPHTAINDTYAVYAGPTQYKTLKALGMSFEKIFSGGFWGLFRMSLLILLGFFHSVFRNYGFAIIALTVTIKVLFIPLTHKSFSSMRRMQELQPKMKVLQEQYKNEPQKLNKEVMELYKKHKVNPLGGCLPLLLQMPIFIALYQVLSEAVELRGAHFMWWIKDLSEPDRFLSLPFTIPILNVDALNILPLLMLGSMIWQQKLTPSTAQSKDQQTMMMLMPIMFGFIFYKMPSGLVLYWLLNNVLTIAQQLYTQKIHPTKPA